MEIIDILSSKRQTLWLPNTHLGWQTDIFFCLWASLVLDAMAGNVEMKPEHAAVQEQGTLRKVQMGQEPRIADRLGVTPFCLLFT